MAALAFIAASLVTLIAAFLFRGTPTQQEIEDVESLRSKIWLPTPILAIAASFYVVKRFDGSTPKLTPFTILIIVCVLFAICAFVASVGFGTPAIHK